MKRNALVKNDATAEDKMCRDLFTEILLLPETFRWPGCVNA